MSAAAAESGFVRVLQSVQYFLEAAAAVTQLVVRRRQVAGARQLLRNMHAVEPRLVLGFVRLSHFVPQRPDSPVHWFWLFVIVNRLSVCRHPGSPCPSGPYRI